MGVLRLFLACVVFVGHLSLALPDEPHVAFVTVGPVEAVELFFLISGFYMALVLDARYAGPGAYRLFLTNRALRVFPGYWLIAAAAALLWAMCGASTTATPNPLDACRALAPTSAVAVALANVAIVGQDALMFAGVDAAGRLTPTVAPGAFAVQPWRALLVPQAWSLSLELTFYLLAPLILRRRTRVVVLLCALSLGVRAALLAYRPMRYDPWTYRFFPAELSLFLLGAIGYRCTPWLIARPRLRAACIVAMAIALLSFGALPGYALLTRWPLYALATLAVPSVFHLTRDWRIDRYVGELSYPLYISHLLVLTFLPAALPTRSRGIVVACCFATTLIVSFGLVHLLFAPIERWRRVRAARPTTSPAVIPTPTTSPPPL